MLSTHRILYFCFILIVLIQTGYPATPVTRITVLNGGVNPEVVLDGKGVLHIVYGKANNAYYVKTGDWGKTFSKPVQLNRQPDTVTVGGERGPKLSLGQDNSVHVVWLGRYDKTGGAWYTRSVDGGKTFEPEKNILDTKTGCDGATVTSDKQGNVFVFWLDGRLPPDPDSPVAIPIFMSHSTDNGVTFAPNQPVKHNHPGRACSCCRLEARIDNENHIYLSFRSGYKNVRDIFLLKGNESENDFKAYRVSDDQWVLNGCPMNGSPFQIDKTGKVSIGWMSQGKVYWSHTQDFSMNFVKRIPTPVQENVQSYPTVAVNTKGETLLVWVSAREVHWTLYDKDGKTTGETGTAGTLEGRSKATAFVGNDDRFYLIF